MWCLPKSGSLTINPGAQLNLGPNALVLDYTTASPRNQVRGLIGSGALSGAGTLGYAEAATLLKIASGSTGTFMGETVDATTLLIVPASPADANSDGTVNFQRSGGAGPALRKPVGGVVG